MWSRVREIDGGARLATDQARVREQFQSNNAQTPLKSKHHQGPEDEARRYERQLYEICKTSIPGSNPGGASNPKWSIPETWVTVHSGDMGNTFGPKGLS